MTPAEISSPKKIDHFASLPFYGMHAACLLAFWTGVSWTAIALCVFLYGLRMFAITAGLHRLLAHASYRTTRWFRFTLAWCAAMSVQKGPLWWASLHRHHHAHSDEEEDIHSPLQDGFWHSHAGWILCHKWDHTMWKLIPDLVKVPELRWVNRYHLIPALLMGVSCYALGAWLDAAYPTLGATGWQLFVWGFFISTVLVYHATFTINSLAHVYGSRRYETKDTSRNNFWMAIFTLGEGWHNNHHFAPSSERQGFFWWEIDIAHYILVALSWVGSVWDIKKPPLRAYDLAERSKAA
ncbi:MAG TPA: acyl-CoA desaturase [Bryobacteraceae bacterium]|nr:acyl-CoA desaturase [Bryobacteraceae bacterium]